MLKITIIIIIIIAIAAIAAIAIAIAAHITIDFGSRPDKAGAGRLQAAFV